MKRSFRLLLIQGIVVTALAASAALAGAATTLTGSQALSSLVSGNSPFILGNFSYLNKMAQPTYRDTLRNAPLGVGQSPYAIVLGCSDSRVSPEIIFDKGLGEVFPIRVAGNIISEHEIGSIEYGVEHLCAPLIVILGHTSCGAVTAAVAHVQANYDASRPLNTPAPVPYHVSIDVPAPQPPYDALAPYVNSLVNTLIPPVVTAFNANPAASAAVKLQAAIVENVKYTAADLLAKSEIIRTAVDLGTPACGGKKTIIKGGLYDVNTGKFSLVPLI